MLSPKKITHSSEENLPPNSEQPENENILQSKTVKIQKEKELTRTESLGWGFFCRRTNINKRKLGKSGSEERTLQLREQKIFWL